MVDEASSEARQATFSFWWSTVPSPLKTKLWTVDFANKLRWTEHLDGVDPVEAGDAMYEVVSH